MIQKFESIPVTIEAAQVTEENLNDLASWCGGKVVVGGTNNTPTFLLYPQVDAPRGVQEAYVGNVLLKGKDGRFSHMTAEKFTNSYTLAVD